MCWFWREATSPFLIALEALQAVNARVRVNSMRKNLSCCFMAKLRINELLRHARNIWVCVALLILTYLRLILCDIPLRGTAHCSFLRICADLEGVRGVLNSGILSVETGKRVGYLCVGHRGG